MKAYVVSRGHWMKGVIYVDNLEAKEVMDLVDRAKSYGNFMSCLRLRDNQWEISIEISDERNRAAFYTEFNSK